MSELRQWLEANAGSLTDLADQLDAPTDMVRLAAVLVLGGLTDAQIGDQLRSVRWDDPDAKAAVGTVLRALPVVRAATRGTGDRPGSAVRGRQESAGELHS